MLESIKSVKSINLDAFASFVKERVDVVYQMDDSNVHMRKLRGCLEMLAGKQENDKNYICNCDHFESHLLHSCLENIIHKMVKS